MNSEFSTELGKIADLLKKLALDIQVLEAQNASMKIALEAIADEGVPGSLKTCRLYAKLALAASHEVSSS